MNKKFFDVKSQRMADEIRKDDLNEKRNIVARDRDILKDDKIIKVLYVDLGIYKDRKGKGNNGSQG